LLVLRDLQSLVLKIVQFKGKASGYTKCSVSITAKMRKIERMMRDRKGGIEPDKYYYLLRIRTINGAMFENINSILMDGV
jgi:hypothetical protein